MYCGNTHLEATYKPRMAKRKGTWRLQVNQAVILQRRSQEGPYTSIATCNRKTNLKKPSSNKRRTLTYGDELVKHNTNGVCKSHLKRIYGRGTEKYNAEILEEGCLYSFSRSTSMRIKKHPLNEK